ncbi:MAG: class I SAM-dependent methyltransferase [Candidatus Eisenbacteria bacterium]|nr:class I SAM-dependent methyltransferase [Candidatus Eisenbacteria bacterium]
MMRTPTILSGFLGRNRNVLAGLQAPVAGRHSNGCTRPWFEAAFSRFYADLYAHRDTAEAESLLDSLQDLLPARGPVLDLACGAGRLLGPLGRRFGEVVGLDLSRDLLAVARERAGSARLVRSDMRTPPFAAGSFAAVFSFFTSFGYFENPADDEAVVARVAHCLQPGGKYVLDFLNAGPVTSELVPKSEQTIGDRRVESSRSFDVASRVIRKTVRVFREDALEVTYEERVRAYTPDELDAIFARSGLEVVHRYGGYAKEPFERDRSLRYVLVGRRMSS